MLQGLLIQWICCLHQKWKRFILKSFSKPKIWNDLKINRELSFDFKSICWKKSWEKISFLPFFESKEPQKQPRKKQPQSEWFSIPIFFQYNAETVFHMSLRPLCKFKLRRKRMKSVSCLRICWEVRYSVLQTKMFQELWCCVGFEEKTK